MNEHHNRSHGQHVQRVGEEDQGPCHQVMEEILGEICTVALVNHRIAELVQVVRELKDVEVI